jgi:uncharacterized protein YndB with AHSA1/START domain
MPTATYRGHIRATPEAVFAFVADAENNPRWHAHVRETRWIDPPPTRLGRRGRQFGHLLFRDWAFVAEVAEWEPPHAVTFQVIDAIASGPQSGWNRTVTAPRSSSPSRRRGSSAVASTRSRVASSSG